MEQEIKKYLNLIDLEENIISFIEIMSLLSNLQSKDINKNAENIAKLFCRSLSKIETTQKVQEYHETIINAFENIKNMTIENEGNSELKTITFLKNLYTRRRDYIIHVDLNVIDNRNTNLDKEKEEFFNLVENLEKINHVFSITDENKNYYFPIGKLLYKIICSENLADTINSVSVIQTLILSLQIFDKQSYRQEINEIRNIVKKSNLIFAEYLMNGAIRINGELWKNNYEKNGVIILYDTNLKKILVRSLEKAYFKLDSTTASFYNISEVKAEVNSKNEPIAYFVEYTLNDFIRVKLEDIIYNNNDIQTLEKIIKLIFNDFYYNIFLDNSLIKYKNNIIPINPFSKNDKYIIYNERRFVFATEEEMISNLKKYSLNNIFEDKLNVINWGTLLELINIDSNFLSCNKIFRGIKNINGLLDKWIKFSIQKKESLLRFCNVYSEKLKFVKTKKEYIKKEYDKDYFIPIQIDKKILRRLEIYSEIANCERVEVKKTEEDFSEEATFWNKNKLKLEYKIINNTEEDFPNEFYIAYNKKENIGYYSVEINEYYLLEEKIDNFNNYLLEQVFINSIDDFEIDIIEKCMTMHKKAFLEVMPYTEFKAIIKFRLIHHLLCFNLNKLNKHNILKWFNIWSQHDIADFSILRCLNKKIIECNEETLIVPKDRSRNQSVFKDIYYEYLKENCKREPIDIYDPKIYIKDGKYEINGKVINNIRFIFDTIQSGSATITCLKNYLFDDERKNNERMEYLCNKTKAKISIKDIIDKNNPKIEVYAVYSSKEGQNKVEDFMKENKYFKNNQKVHIEKELTQVVTDDILSFFGEIYKNFSAQNNEGFYITIREFNQPKKNLFVDRIMNPRLIISLLVKKLELRK